MSKQACSLLPGVFGILMQGLLLCCACAVLVFKKVTETRRRSWLSFLLDASKQLAGAGWIHAMNLLFAVELHRILRAGDPCLWYWLHIIVDTTAGVAVEYGLLELLMICLRRCLGPAADEFGAGRYYEDVQGVCEFRWHRYAKQLALWLFVVSLMKLAMVGLLVALSRPLLGLGQLVLARLDGSPKAKLAVVMIVTPLIMNSFQLWLVDAFLREKKDAGREGAPCAGVE